ncbi:HpcH/HpaI aldolase family protein [Altericroceibacterium endophyticum]|uniref:2-dehydro-3-deoxyglucarate aldolase n=1 Tax=Altericroceibacterium endophyticum TaxID=1808508 RepID=A0A6I4TB52_9SPHN|nr:aldolase/citrate lyase family protein [Altericroceibacterium endophyticum]MXO67100.1 2-dehydro-3-deoxyglucarate aldolase [Altericroceibacterium endophyticum]
MMQNFLTRAHAADRGLLGTWVKLPSFETVQMLGQAGFDFVVVDMEHAPHSLQRAVELVFCAQSCGMAALVRLPDHSGMTIQPLLDGGADGLLIPRVTAPAIAQSLTRRMTFAPAGERGLGTTSRAGQWGLGAMEDYLARGTHECARIVQLEDWQSLESARDFAQLEHVDGLFIGHGDLYLSSGKPAHDPEVRALTGRMVAVTKDAGILSAAAAANPEDAQLYLDMGFSLVMVSNDLTLFGKAAAELVTSARKRS